MGDQVPGGVPEPGTWAMMLLGFGGIGFAMRRGRKQNGRLLQIANSVLNSVTLAARLTPGRIALGLCDLAIEQTATLAVPV